MTEAHEQAETALRSAREEAETTLTSARTEADTALTTAREAAAQLDAESAARSQAALGGLEETRRSLEVQVEDLRHFEREYRTRLRAHLEGQLAELDGRPAADPDVSADASPVG